MAKTTVSKHSFYVVDLIRSKPKLQFIELPKYRVDVEIELTKTSRFRTPDPIPSTKFKRLEKEGRKALDYYESEISAAAVELDEKIAKLMETPGKKAQDDAKKMIEATNASIKKALASAEGAANKEIAKALADEARKDKLLTEARLKTTVKVSVGVIKIGGSVAKLVATSGADVTSYKTIVMQVVKLGLEVKQQLKKEDQLRQDLINGIQAFISLRGTMIMQAAERQKITDTSGISVKHPQQALKMLTNKFVLMGEEVTHGQDPKKVRQKMTDFVIKGVKSKLNDAEKARKAYREHTTKTRHSVDDLGLNADKLMKKARATKTLKDGVRIGAECMSVKREASAMATKLDEREKFLAEMQALMAGNGLEIDDTTLVEKVKALKKMTIATEGKTAFGAIKSVASLVENVAKAAS